VRISVIGCGYLGAVHAACLARLGHEVVGIDVVPEQVDALSTGKPPDLDRVSVEDVGHDASRSLAAARGVGTGWLGVEYVAVEGEASNDPAYADDDHQGHDHQREDSNRRARNHRAVPRECDALPAESAAASPRPDLLGVGGSSAGRALEAVWSTGTIAA
jgi:hypothetical protein